MNLRRTICLVLEIDSHAPRLPSCRRRAAAVVIAAAMALAAWPVWAAPGPERSAACVDGTSMPEGLSASSLSSIRAVYEAGRHAAYPDERHSGGSPAYLARNPGQQWRTRFDGRGFETTPNGGGWTWGLELVGWGVDAAQRAVSEPACVAANGGRVSYEWDDHLTEWYINDTRGLEHGYTVHRRPESHRFETGATVSHELRFTLAVRGELYFQISTDRRNVTFVKNSGAAVVNYKGLKVIDARGAELPAWFEAASTPQSFCIIVNDEDAHYPLTIDPVAQQAYLKASNTGANDQFGWSVAISGDTVVVGAWAEDSNATGVNGNQADNSAGDAGAAYVFVRDAMGTWSQQAYLKPSNTNAGDAFGWAVAISGDTIVVSAIGEDSSATGVGGNEADNTVPLSGAVYVFVRNGTTWSQQAYLKASNTGAGDRFGEAVAADGDTVVVGAFRESSNATGVNGNQADNSAAFSGAAYVFVRDQLGAWSQQAYLKASNTEFDDSFAYSVAVSGETVLIGAPLEASSATGIGGNQADNSAFGAGAAYVFVRDAMGIWSQQAYLKASNTEANDQFGWSVAASGETVLIGARQEDSNATGVNGNEADNSAGNAGAAYVFVRSGPSWSQQAYLKASNTEFNESFGNSVSVSGNAALIAAVNEDSNATGVNGNQADNSAGGAGAAYLFVRGGTTWNQQAYLKASNTDAGDQFGVSVNVSGDTVVVGANQEDSSATGVDGSQADNSFGNAGAAYVFLLPPDCDGDGFFDESDNCPLIANPGQADADNDGAGDDCDVCPGTVSGLPVDSTGRPHRDCNGDCLYDAADIQCLVDEMLNP